MQNIGDEKKRRTLWGSWIDRFAVGCGRSCVLGSLLVVRNHYASFDARCGSWNTSIFFSYLFRYNELTTKICVPYRHRERFQTWAAIPRDRIVQYQDHQPRRFYEPCRVPIGTWCIAKQLKNPTGSDSSCRRPLMDWVPSGVDRMSILAMSMAKNLHVAPYKFSATNFLRG